ncbi:MAG TPA: hypothetical protein DEP69_07160, partial [Acidimicrobiaceae bacterium]|nr:hypothetical protein [Acidimicrobiaceae bacterium]
MTDTAVATETSAAAEAAGVLVEDPGAAGWLHTSDHKRIGRMFVTVSLFFAVPAVVADLLLRLDLADAAGSPVLGLDAFAQVFALTRESLVLLVLIPVFLGIAVYVVPLQIGASNVAFPRAAAASFWGWLVSAGVLVGAYAGNGGPYGGWSDGVDLHLLAIAGLVLSLLAGAVTVAVTVLTMRSPGLYLDATPPFAWSALVTASMLVVSLPVLLGQIAILYVDHRYGSVFLDGAAGVWQRVDWVYRTPQLFIYVVPVLGVVAEVVLAATRRRVLEPLALYFSIGLVGLFGFGAWANLGITTEGADLVDGAEGIVLVGLYAGAAAAVAGLLGLLGLTIVQNRRLPRLTTAVLAALGAGKLLLLAAVVGLVGAAADWLNIAGRGVDGNALLGATTFVTGQQSALVYGAGLLGLLAALHWWAPKLWGRTLSEGAGRLSFVVIGAGAFLAWLGPVLSGAFAEQPQFVYHDPALTTRYETLTDSSAAPGLTMLGAVGVVLVLLGVVVTKLNIGHSVLLRKGAPAGADPWPGVSPEWLLDSPPPPGEAAGLP